MKNIYLFLAMTFVACAPVYIAQPADAPTAAERRISSAKRRLMVWRAIKSFMGGVIVGVVTQTSAQCLWASDCGMDRKAAKQLVLHHAMGNEIPTDIQQRCGITITSTGLSFSDAKIQNEMNIFQSFLKTVSIKDIQKFVLEMYFKHGKDYIDPISYIQHSPIDVVAYNNYLHPIVSLGIIAGCAFLGLNFFGDSGHGVAIPYTSRVDTFIHYCDPVTRAVRDEVAASNYCTAIRAISGVAGIVCGAFAFKYITPRIR